LKWTGKEWLERHVAEKEDAFTLVDLPLSSDQLRQHAQMIPLPLPDGYETEINLEALRWLDALAPKLEAGFVVVVDYGLPREEFFAPHRDRGTLQCYANHRVLSSPLEQIGEADLTAHVEWSSLAERAEIRGLTSAGFSDQHHFITGLLDESLLNTVDEKTRRALHTLMHPGFLGMKFQYLVLASNIGDAATLSGLRFARPRP
jgi:SAM-dependent MidA family methyltransferase